MGQLTQNIIYFNDNSGAIRPNSEHFFYESGKTTDKAVYADKELTTPLAQPVISSSDGILPQIWLGSGGYRWVGKDSAGIQFFDRDNINIGDSIIDTASALIFKNVNDMVLGILANGDSVDLQPDQTAYTQGEATQTDGNGKEYLILSADSGVDVALNNGRFAHAQANFINSSDVDTIVDAKIDEHNDLAFGLVHVTMMTGHNNSVSAHAAAIDPKISTHNSDSAAHGNIDNKISTAVSDHNSSASAHGNIDNKISTAVSDHNSDSAAHGNIDNKISTAVSDGVSAHNISGTAHTDIRSFISTNTSDIDDLQLAIRSRSSCNVSAASATRTQVTTSSNSIIINSAAKGGTGIYNLTLTSGVAIDTIQLTPIYPIASGGGGADRTYTVQHDDDIPMNGTSTTNAFTVRCFSTLAGGALVDGSFRITVFYTE